MARKRQTNEDLLELVQHLRRAMAEEEIVDSFLDRPLPKSAPPETVALASRIRRTLQVSAPRMQNLLEALEALPEYKGSAAASGSAAT